MSMDWLVTLITEESDLYKSILAINDVGSSRFLLRGTECHLQATQGRPFWGQEGPRENGCNIPKISGCVSLLQGRKFRYSNIPKHWE